MKIPVLLLLFFLVLFQCASAQKENYNWYFGNRAAINFNSSPPTVLLSSAMNQKEGSASISDQNGNLLFYTSGTVVYNKNHVKMPNGDSLGGGSSATQSALIIPFPETFGIFYVFTVQQLENPQPTHFRYSVVDMALDSGRGDVSTKNVVITSPVTEKLCAVKHANGHDIWVMVHGYRSYNFYAYLVSNSGISAPVVSTIGDSIYSARGVGQMKFSSDGTKLAHAIAIANVVDLFDFDASTGILSNEKRLPLPWQPNPMGILAGAYGLEFSSNGNHVYVSTDDSTAIYQWDITSNDTAIIMPTFQKIGLLGGGGGALQLGPDGKIYAASYGASYLGVINSPQIGGLGCNYIQNAINLSPKSCTFGLPNFMANDLLITRIKKEDSKINSVVYPNPAHDKLTAVFNSSTENESSISLFDVTGRVVLQKSFHANVGENKIEMDITGVAKGVYFLNTTAHSTNDGLGNGMWKVVIE